MRKFILDIDTGIDDTMALTYLVAQKDIEIVGLIATYGNVYVEQAYKNTVNMLNVLGRSDIKVYMGAEHALSDEKYVLPPVKARIHGENGIGNVVLPECTCEVPDMKGYEFMLEACEKYGEELTIISVGPMTNLALALRKDAKTLKKAGKIVVMGGALTVPGNASLFAEANFFADPLAAKELLESDIEKTMVGLDVTHQTILDEDDIAVWTGIDTLSANALVTMCTYYYNNEGDSVKKVSGCLHDPLAVEVALNPAVITTYYDADLTCETEGASFGRSIGNREKTLWGPRNTHVCLRVNAAEFVPKFTKTIANYLSHCK